MELLQIVLGLVAAACFFEWNVLRHNKIKNDEKVFAIMGFILLGILLLSLFFETKDIPNLFSWW